MRNLGGELFGLLAHVQGLFPQLLCPLYHCLYVRLCHQTACTCVMRTHSLRLSLVRYRSLSPSPTSLSLCLELVLPPAKRTMRIVKKHVKDKRVHVCACVCACVRACGRAGTVAGADQRAIRVASHADGLEPGARTRHADCPSTRQRACPPQA